MKNKIINIQKKFTALAIILSLTCVGYIAAFKWLETEILGVNTPVEISKPVKTANLNK